MDADRKAWCEDGLEGAYPGLIVDARYESRSMPRASATGRPEGLVELHRLYEGRGGEAAERGLGDLQSDERQVLVWGVEP